MQLCLLGERLKETQPDTLPRTNAERRRGRSQERNRRQVAGRYWGESDEDDAVVAGVLAWGRRTADARGADGRAGDGPQAGRVQGPHAAQGPLVKVAPGVELEVLDWGGTGEAMVLLTGLGDNAHVYDQFAFQFTDDFHVIGITRRGYLPSSQPRNGYDVPTRAADDIAVLDALGIDKAIFVGHSLAGAELSELGRSIKRAWTSWSIWMLPTWQNASCPRAPSRLFPCIPTRT